MNRLLLGILFLLVLPWSPTALPPTTVGDTGAAIDVDFAVTRVALSTGAATTTQDITISGFGTPKGAMVIVTGATADATATDYARFSVGFTDCTENVVTNFTSEHASDPSDTWAVGTTTQLILLTNTTATTIDGEASIASCITDGIRITIDNQFGAAYLATVVLFGGADLTAEVGSFANNAAIDGTTDVTDVGFEPDVVFVIGNRDELDDSVQINTGMCYGVAVNGGGQGSVGWQEADNQSGTTVITSILSTQYACHTVLAGSARVAVQLGTFDASGFTATTKEEAVSDEWGYLALNLGGSAAWAGNVTTAGTTGAQSFTTPGFEPRLLVGFISTAQAVNTLETDGDAGTVGLFVRDTANSYCTTATSEDATTPSDAQVLTDNQVLNVPDETGATLIAGTFTSFDTTGWTWNLGTAAAREFYVLALD